MCAEDLNSQVFSHFRRMRHDRSGSSKKSVWVEDCSPTLEKILAGSLRTNHHYHHHEDLQDAVMWFVASVVQELFSYGVSSFEMCLGWDQAESPRHLRDATLLWIPYESILQIGRKVYQVVPAKAPEGHSPGKVVAIEPGRLIVFRPPNEWARRLNQIRSGLTKLGKSEFTWMGSMVDPMRTKEDFTTVKRSYAVAMGRLVAPIGWNARGLMNDEMGDVHAAVRNLRWKRFSIDLRDKVLADLAKVFLQIGQHLGESPVLKWDHLLSYAQIQADEADLMQPSGIP